MSAIYRQLRTKALVSGSRTVVSRPQNRQMATIRGSFPHEYRTAAEPRANRVETVRLEHIREINDNVRLLQLQVVDPNHTINFLPGQWLDTFIPGIEKAGGFTITSSPSEARPSSFFPPYLELAVQKSTNPPAQWLWRPADEILGTQLVVRVGGSFTWPPPQLDVQQIERLVLVAGGVGINPLISILAHLVRSRTRPREIHFVYATKADPELDPHKMLFVPRLLDLVASAADPRVTLRLFLTGTGDDAGGVIEHGKLPNRTVARRIAHADLSRALDGYQPSVFGPEHDRKNTVCYVCGPPRMTDEFVEYLSAQPGMSADRVLREKWW